ncbi:MAG TPA: tRNA (adenosine(37)-N6)-threonylcarbamoyltransferase complex transferase subunit TsaD [Ktedonobacterales bacterium]|jgi:N6-L-threonylcarbamoyladenine synthase|nr:tRNA (adenosine(37)-N6)-threonylcarbamoyltransferase complex transferase subunit TsaD [Ktedonobacterales bacterium]
MRILGIESSCDETGAAIVEDGRRILSNVVASQASVHERYGGVVPEVASRQQLSAFIPVVETALAEANIGWESIDAIAVTYGPGLAGSLLVGLTGAKTLAFVRRLPFLGVNHLEAHIYANWLRPGAEKLPVGTDGSEADELPGDPRFPLLALVVSGAHTELVSIARHGHYELLGQTRDDAAGEAFDKVARVLGLGYPGGPAIQRAAEQRDPARPNPYNLPRAWLPGTSDFSFSGLKTAVLQFVSAAESGEVGDGASRYARTGAAAAASGGIAIPDLAAAFQEAVVDVLATKTVRAARELGVRRVVLAGGVAANLALRTRLDEQLRPIGIDLRYPPVAFCTDNAAMIASAGYFHLRLGERSGFELDVRPNLQLPFAVRR